MVRKLLIRFFRQIVYIYFDYFCYLYLNELRHLMIITVFLLKAEEPEPEPDEEEEPEEDEAEKTEEESEKEEEEEVPVVRSSPRLRKTRSRKE